MVMGKYKLHKKFTPYKHSYKIPHGVSMEEMTLASAVQLEFPKTKIYRSNRQILGSKEIDIWIPSHNLGIEFNGNRYHSSAMGKDGSYHLNKTILAERKHVHLLHIFSDMWETSKSQTIDRIKKLMSKYQTMLMDECSIKQLTKREGQEFYNSMHLNGVDSRADRFIGIFYNGYIVSVLEYSNKAIYGYQDIRNLKIQNGLQSILDAYPELKSLPVYVDRSLLENLEWEEIGYKQIECTNPRLFYTKDFKSRIPESRLTESQKSDMHTIYDCGELVLKKELSN